MFPFNSGGLGQPKTERSPTGDSKWWWYVVFPSSNGHESTEIPTTSDARWKVLLADDDEGLRVVLSRLLNCQGYDVRPVASASEAIAACKRRGPFHVLLTDVRLPEITGLELAHRVRRFFPEAGVVAMSGHPRSLVEQSIYWCRRYGFVEKPFRTRSLLRLVEEALPITA